MKQTKILFSFGILLLAAISCTSDEYISSDKIGTGVSFDVSVAQLQELQGESFKAPAITNTPMKGKGTHMYLRQTTVGTIDQHMEADFKTRGTKVNAINNFKLYSYKYSGSWSSSFSTATQVSNGVILESGNNWKLTTPWADTSMAFFGIYDETNSASFSTNSGGELTYTVPSAVADQKDLLVAKNVDITEATNDSKVPMTFSHALTAVQFGIGSVMAPGTITKVELQGIKNSGIYRYTNNTWTASSTTTTYTISNLNVDIASNKGSGGTKLFTGSNNDLLLLMPQTLGSDAKLVVYITEKGNPKTLSVSLANGQWKAGHTVTYSLTTNSDTGQYVFIVGDLDKSNVGENGGTVSSTIKSYYQDYYGTQTAVGWTATYSVDGGTSTSSTGDVVKSFVSSGVGNSNYSLTIGEVEKIFISNPNYNNHTKTLREKSIEGSQTNYINLAGTDGLETTANSYIVSAPGYYKFPVVYGNGLKYGQKNITSITGSSSFVNHLGNKVTAAYLKENQNVTPTKAFVLWQDAYHLVYPPSITLSSDKQYISFYVPKEYICQGNCVIAVSDGAGTIMWSWHIWVTDQNMATVTSINGSDTYNFMPVALGHCDADTRNYSSHSINVTITQNGSRTIRNFTITQSTTSTQNISVSAPYYQWGRKDPQHPSDFKNGVWKPLYDNYYENISTGTGYNSNAASLADGIKNPHISFGASGNWSTNTSYDLWHVGNTKYQEVYTKSSNPVIKSIYDPCPVGFKMPEPAAFGSFSASSPWTNNSRMLINNNYWYAYGYIIGGLFYGLGTEGYYWSASPYMTQHGYYIGFNSSGVYPTSTYYRANCFSIRPVSE